jgi:DNA-binding FadR family transcriptional regulator
LSNKNQQKTPPFHLSPDRATTQHPKKTGRWSLVCLDYSRLREACADGDAEWARDILERLL